MPLASALLIAYKIFSFPHWCCWCCSSEPPPTSIYLTDRSVVLRCTPFSVYFYGNHAKTMTRLSCTVGFSCLDLNLYQDSAFRAAISEKIWQKMLRRKCEDLQTVVLLSVLGKIIEAHLRRQVVPLRKPRYARLPLAIRLCLYDVPSV